MFCKRVLGESAPSESKSVPSSRAGTRLAGVPDPEETVSISAPWPCRCLHRPCHGIEARSSATRKKLSLRRVWRAGPPAARVFTPTKAAPRTSAGARISTSSCFGSPYNFTRLGPLSLLPATSMSWLATCFRRRARTIPAIVAPALVLYLGHLETKSWNHSHFYEVVGEEVETAYAVRHGPAGTFTREIYIGTPVLGDEWVRHYSKVSLLHRSSCIKIFQRLVRSRWNTLSAEGKCALLKNRSRGRGLIPRGEETVVTQRRSSFSFTNNLLTCSLVAATIPRRDTTTNGSTSGNMILRQP